MKEAKMTFWDLIIGIILLTLLFGIVGVMLTEDKLAFFLGIVFGGAVAAGLCLHMYKTLEVTLDLDEESAVRRGRTMTGVRMAIMAAAIFAAIQFSGTVSIIAVILGILTLKFAAFIQPLVHKCITMKILTKEGESVNQGIAFVNLIRASNDVSLGVKSYGQYELFGQTLHITTTHISILIVLIVLFAFAIAANIAIKRADPNEVPGPFLNIVELMVESLDNLVVSNMGAKQAPKFANYVGTLAAFIFFSNISGLFGLRPPTADYGVTFPLAIITWVMIQYNGFKYQKFGKIKGLFEPIFLFFPINLIGEFATPISMSLRLFGNILSGTVMLTLIYGLLPRVATLIWPAALHAYLDVFSGAIQTFVFIMLTMVFIADAIGDEASA